MILMLGDIHGNFNYLRNAIEMKRITDCIIIQVGDFGIGFTDTLNDKRIMESLNLFLNEKRIMLYAIRGNHDNPDCFDGTWKWSNLELVPDYHVLNLEGHNILCIGGALSIDRKPRIKENMSNARWGINKKAYWYDEEVVLNTNFLENVRDIDILVTHTAPDFCNPNNNFGFPPIVEEFAYNDPHLKDELNGERLKMTQIWDTLTENNKVTKHFYGHFHRSHIEKHVDCEHILLNINELKELI